MAKTRSRRRRVTRSRTRANPKRRVRRRRRTTTARANPRRRRRRTTTARANPRRRRRRTTRRRPAARRRRRRTTTARANPRRRRRRKRVTRRRPAARRRKRRNPQYRIRKGRGGRGRYKAGKFLPSGSYGRRAYVKRGRTRKTGKKYGWANPFSLKGTIANVKRTLTSKEDLLGFAWGAGGAIASKVVGGFVCAKMRGVIGPSIARGTTAGRVCESVCQLVAGIVTAGVVPKKFRKAWIMGAGIASVAGFVEAALRMVVPAQYHATYGLSGWISSGQLNSLNGWITAPPGMNGYIQALPGMNGLAGHGRGPRGLGYGMIPDYAGQFAMGGTPGAAPVPVAHGAAVTF